MTQTLYKFRWDVPRQGEIESLFIADSEQVEAVMGMTVYFGEVLGKHSDVQGTLDPEDLTIITQDQRVIADLIRLFAGDRWGRSGSLCGLNPLHSLQDDEGNDFEFPPKLPIDKINTP